MKHGMMRKTAWALLLTLALTLAGCGNGPEIVTEINPTGAATTAATTAPTTVATEPTTVPTTVATEPTTVPTTAPTEPTTEPTTVTTEPTTEATTEATAEPTETTEPEGTHYVLNKNSKKFHYPDCSSAKQIKDSNRKDFTGSRQELIKKGYDPCKRCKP